MEEGESILEAIYQEDDAFEEVEDVEMADVEEGEINEQKPPRIGSEHDAGDQGRYECAANQASLSKNRRRKEKRKNKRKNKGGSEPKVTDINRFVIDTCRRLREKKSYMVYTAVGCLGISRLSDLVKEVDAIQSCGGQMTNDGGRCRTGGGILWNIMKTKEPMAYKEIMKKTNEFEKQFKPRNIRQGPQKNKELSSQEMVITADDASSTVLGGCELGLQNQQEQSSAKQKYRPVHDRIRVPVSYDDLLGDDSQNDAAISEKLDN